MVITMEFGGRSNGHRDLGLPRGRRALNALSQSYRNLTGRLTSHRSNPTCSHRPSHARSPTIKHYCPSHGALWFEELSRPLRKGGASMSPRTNGTSPKCVLVARVPQSYQLLPATYKTLTSAYFDRSRDIYLQLGISFTRRRKRNTLSGCVP